MEIRNLFTDVLGAAMAVTGFIFLVFAGVVLLSKLLRRRGKLKPGKTPKARN